MGEGRQGAGFSDAALELAEAFQKAGTPPDILMAIEAQEFSVEGYFAFFHLMNGFPLHSEGKKWIRNAFRAQEEQMGLAQECHREAGKTTVFSLFFALFLIGHNPEGTGGVIRINDEKANETTKAMASIIEDNPKWKLVFPHVEPDKQKGWGEHGYYVKRSDITYAEWTDIRTSQPQYPTFVGYGWKSGSVLGHRFSLFCIVDDIHDRDNTRSERQLAEVKTFYKKTLTYCIMDGCWEIWNFTPWRFNDVYAYIKATGEYIHSKTPVMVPAKKSDPGAEYWPPAPLNRQYPDAGDIPISGRWYKRYHPEKWTWERIAKDYRHSGPVEFAQMMMLDLEATMGRTLRQEWLHYYEPGDDFETWAVYMGVDFASTEDRLKTDDPDYFSLAVGRVIPGGGLVVCDGYRGILSKGEALQKIAQFAHRYPGVTSGLVGIEAIGEGRGFYTDVMQMFDLTGTVVPLFPIKSHGRMSKGDRFENYLGPKFQAARVWLVNKENEFIRRFEEEWLTYPDCDHDDVLDAVYMLAKAAEGRLAGAFLPGFGGTIKNENPFAGFAKRLRS